MGDRAQSLSPPNPTSEAERGTGHTPPRPLQHKRVQGPIPPHKGLPQMCPSSPIPNLPSGPWKWGAPQSHRGRGTAQPRGHPHFRGNKGSWRRLTRSSSTGVSIAAAPCRLKQVTTAARSRSRSAVWAGGWSRVPWPGTESGRQRRERGKQRPVSAGAAPAPPLPWASSGPGPGTGDSAARAVRAQPRRGCPGSRSSAGPPGGARRWRAAPAPAAAWPAREPGSGRATRPPPRGALGQNAGTRWCSGGLPRFTARAATARQFAFPCRSHPHHGVGQRGRCGQWGGGSGAAGPRSRSLPRPVAPGLCRRRGRGSAGGAGGARAAPPVRAALGPAARPGGDGPRRGRGWCGGPISALHPAVLAVRG